MKKESKYKNSKEIGFIGEKAFEFLCSLNRIDFLKEPSENKPYDYVFIINNIFYKVQVKTSEFIDSTKNTIRFDVTKGNSFTLKESDRYYNSEDFDFVFLYCIENNRSFLVSMKDKKPIREITIRLNKPKSNQIKNINFADDLDFLKVIKEMDR